MIKSCNDNCYGCENCANKCPTGAISIKYDNEGFYKPFIDSDKCIACGICDKFCIIGEEKNYYQKDFEQEIYIGYSKNLQDIEKSSSGGIFPLLVKWCLNNNGYVSGPIFKDGILTHTVTSDCSECEKMRGAKYIQSKIGTCYKEIESILKKNKLVLFSGTPCQVASLRKFLHCEYKNLITIDILCHSIPSSLLFQQYIEEMLNKNVKILDCSFRNKMYGWHLPSLTVLTDSGSYNTKLSDDSFSQAFFESLISNRTCSNCDYASMFRTGDFTIGDAWCAQYLFRDFENTNGTSLFMINSKKAKALFEEISRKLVYKQIKKDEAICGNPILVKPFKPHILRDDIFKIIKENKTINKILSNSIKIDKNIAILNFSFENNNYGAILTSFALNKLINKAGYRAFNIDYAPTWYDRNKKNIDFEGFKKQNIKMTKPCDTIEDLRELNKFFTTFIVGSDQVFRPKFAADQDGVYYLNFVKNNKRKIACSASFGVDFFEGDWSFKRKVRYFLSKFDFLSVREDSGVKIIQDIINRPVAHILDPVFYLDKNDYTNMFNNTILIKKIVSYLLDENIRDKINKLSGEIFNIRKGLSIEDWLETISKAKFVITDSFHAICFCLIFNRKFAVVVSKECPIERIYSLFRTFNIDISKILILDKNSITLNDIYKNSIDPNSIQQLIKNKSYEHKHLFLDMLKAPILKTNIRISVNSNKIKKIKKKIRLANKLTLKILNKYYVKKLDRINLINEILSYERNNE